MLPLPPGWATDLAVLTLTGSTVDDRRDHLVVRTPANPGYHWGNFVLVTEDAAVADASRWIAVFGACFPDADWLAIGLVRPPEDERAWVAHGLRPEVDDVLTTSTLPREAPLPDGCTARRLHGDDWEQVLRRALAENVRSGEEAPAAYEAYARRLVAVRRELSDRDTAAFFGAFTDGQLVADLGVVRCGAVARYQSVSTDEAHRGRGLASHLLGVAGRWAGEHGCRRWVIVTDAANRAARVYRRAGFEADVGSALVHRRPARAAADATQLPARPAG